MPGSAFDGSIPHDFPDGSLHCNHLRLLQSCADIEQEFLLLQRHERGVDEEATSGQAKQILWGGIWSVMADEKLESVARQKIRDRERQLYEAKLKKDCS